jgi:hypothetical protein
MPARRARGVTRGAPLTTRPRDRQITLRSQVAYAGSITSGLDEHATWQSFTALPAHKIEVWQWGTSGSWWSIAELNAFR